MTHEFPDTTLGAACEALACLLARVQAACPDGADDGDAFTVTLGGEQIAIGLRRIDEDTLVAQVPIGALTGCIGVLDPGGDMVIATRLLVPVRYWNQGALWTAPASLAASMEDDIFPF